MTVIRTTTFVAVIHKKTEKLAVLESTHRVQTSAKPDHTLHLLVNRRHQVLSQCST